MSKRGVYIIDEGRLEIESPSSKKEHLTCFGTHRKNAKQKAEDTTLQRHYWFSNSHCGQHPTTVALQFRHP